LSTIVCISVLFYLAIVLSVLRITTSNYPLVPSNFSDKNNLNKSNTERHRQIVKAALFSDQYDRLLLLTLRDQNFSYGRKIE